MLHYVNTIDIYRLDRKLFELPYMTRDYNPGHFLRDKPFEALIKWTKEVEITMYWNGTHVYFESEEDRLNFQFVWTFPPYGPQG